MPESIGEYTWTDRFLHKLAFSSPVVQRVLADLEDSLFGKNLTASASRDPVFITSLPRAGTTILLTALAELPSLASHTYRDMPFVMAPVLWSKLSSSLQKNGPMIERAHGDGIEVGFDSPEAFEEVIWRNFWPDKYQDETIQLWTQDDALSERTDFFRKHFSKIVALRCGPVGEGGRYISKNNGNIARLDLIHHMFPDAQIILPIREPMEHAASLLRQHLNFLQQHQSAGFTKRYMLDIGHLEFGELHRPIQFPGLEKMIDTLSPTCLDYWLQYWISAFEYVAERVERLIILAHEDLCDRSLSTTSGLLETLGISNAGAASQVASYFRSRSPSSESYPEYSKAIRKRAENLYRSLTTS